MKARRIQSFASSAFTMGCVALAGLPHSALARQAPTEPRVLFDFEADRLPEAVVAESVRLKLTSADGVTSGNQALQVTYPTESMYKKVAFDPETPWDVSDLGACSIAIDVMNVSEDSAQLYLTLKDAGQSVTAHANIGPGAAVTCYYDLAGPNNELPLGMTGWPARGAREVSGGNAPAVPFRYAWGARKLDLSSLGYIGLYQKGNLTERVLVIDRVRVVPNPAGDAAKLDPLVDAFGQYVGDSWPGKIATTQALKLQAEREASALAKGGPPKDRSKFGGWAAGPRLQATGYFRTEKVDGKWALVDPEGYLFFGAGIANCRLSNTYTITGMDDGNIASELRRNLFAWLPPSDDPLAAHYGYAASVHTGPLEQGQTFSFYAANLHRKYGAEYMDAWREASLNRMLDWGFTCLGNWTDAGFFGNGRVPYFAHAWIRGDHGRVSTGNDYWAPMHDPYDPAFVAHVKESLSALDEQVKGDPWCVGVFVENELSWGNENSDANRFGIVINTLGRDAASCPAKAAFVRQLKTRYGTIAALNQAWAGQVESWDAFAAGFAHAGALTGTRRADFALLSEALAAEYFSVVNRALKALMPHHLFCGSRFADWGMTPEAVRAAAHHTDVVSYNLYTEGLPGHFGDWLAELDRPSILGEYHFGATDRGMFHGGICTAANQKDRGVKYTRYMRSVIENPYFVGAHWFQYVDSPTTGRAVDGENYNSGFVSVTDTPYEELVDAARALNRNLYDIRFGALRESGGKR